MKYIFTFLFVLAGLLAQPLFAEIPPDNVDRVRAEDADGEGSKPSTEEESNVGKPSTDEEGDGGEPSAEEEDPDCE